VPEGVSPDVFNSPNMLNFLQGPATIEVYLAPQGDQTQVILSVALLREQFPLLSDAKGIEFDKSAPLLLYFSPSQIEDVLAQHHEQFAELGWQARAPAEGDEGKGILVFDAPRRQPLKLEVLKTGNGTLVQISRLPAELDGK
jgi:hypothetical protein